MEGLLPCNKCKKRVYVKFDNYGEVFFIQHAPLLEGELFCDEPICEGTWSGEDSTVDAVKKKWNKKQINAKIQREIEKLKERE